MPEPDDNYESTLEVTISRDMGTLIRVAAEQRALLLVLSGTRLGHRLVLGDAPIDVGRGSAAGLILDADSVSRKHARIERFGGGHKIVDLGSTNGTYVNGIKIKEHILTDGDRIGIGKALLKYMAGGNIEGAYHEEVQRLMRFDPLTNVFNKRHFDESLRLAVFTAAGASRALSLIVFDLDHFKKVNDTHGHMAGDAVLCGASQAVQSILSPTEVFGRVGGEEFAVLCEDTELAAALERAEAIRRAVSREPYVFEEKRLPATVSVGVAQLAAAEEAEGLFERADEQLYAAKGAGRNCVRPSL
ncbi:MAG TPA: GGDEF domain-containing protein [Polyangiaceae bacterium]|nr:GGDEF domain-containing protein [Polyangiaceae bacterium]